MFKESQDESDQGGVVEEGTQTESNAGQDDRGSNFKEALPTADERALAEAMGNQALRENGNLTPEQLESLKRKFKNEVANLTPEQLESLKRMAEAIEKGKTPGGKIVNKAVGRQWVAASRKSVENEDAAVGAAALGGLGAFVGHFLLMAGGYEDFVLNPLSQTVGCEPLIIVASAFAAFGVGFVLSAIGPDVIRDTINFVGNKLSRNKDGK